MTISGGHILIYLAIFESELFETMEKLSRVKHFARF